MKTKNLIVCVCTISNTDTPVDFSGMLNEEEFCLGRSLFNLNYQESSSVADFRRSCG